MFDKAMHCLKRGGEVEIVSNYNMAITATFVPDEIMVYEDSFDIIGDNIKVVIFPDRFEYSEEDGIWFNDCQSIKFI